MAAVRGANRRRYGLTQSDYMSNLCKLISVVEEKILLKSSKLKQITYSVSNSLFVVVEEVVLEQSWEEGKKNF